MIFVASALVIGEKMTKYTNMPDMADEDFQILVAITNDLTKRIGTFRINLPNGAYIGNGAEPSAERFTFAGIDAIFEAKSKLNTAGVPADAKYELIMPSNYFNGRKKIGSVFEMDLYVDPTCPKDRFIIREAENNA